MQHTCLTYGVPTWQEKKLPCIMKQVDWMSEIMKHSVVTKVNNANS
jgi:hypothetical protein